ncbi:DUF1499 domain-containing protein [Roseiterribacter gracilis]|uniref:DUF1499 domain-containing protein n=1 Tax=Roseiterribacter gracilis TaxID=2812848 RepID=A0A8S8X8F0_9PROT|nr:hypothetical protein TMPK1_03280 [Rhodospirillales bacterium TMPK1]
MMLLKSLLATLFALVLLALGWRLYLHLHMPALIERYGRPVDFATLQRSNAPHDYLRALAEDAPKAPADAPPLLLPQAPQIVAGTIQTLFGDRILARNGNDFALLDRTPLLGFPDFITLSVRSGPTGSRVLAYSTSVYGHADFGTNRRRIDAWLATLDEAR